ncbi:hypothetical protein ACWEOZ_08285 [Actinoplanes sp. NPDC004185]
MSRIASVPLGTVDPLAVLPALVHVAEFDVRHARLVPAFQIRERRRRHHAVRAQALGLGGRTHLHRDAPDGHQQAGSEQAGSDEHNDHPVAGGPLAFLGRERLGHHGLLSSCESG